MHFVNIECAQESTFYLFLPSERYIRVYGIGVLRVFMIVGLLLAIVRVDVASS